MTVLLFLVASVSAQSIYEVQTGALPREGQVIDGFEVSRVSDFDMLGAEVFEFTHIGTGAKVMYVANGDTNRTFEIAFRTPTEDDTGIPHVFEHSTLDGSQKYPSKELF